MRARHDPLDFQPDANAARNAASSSNAARNTDCSAGDISSLNTRADAFVGMLRHAEELGANAVVGVRYDATEVMQGVTEVLCYGTAVTVHPA